MLYAVTDTALYRTTNGGGSWQLVNDDAFGTVSPWAIAIDPTDSLRVYRASGQGVFVSTDGGVTFSPANRGLPGLAMHAIAAGADGTLVASPLLRRRLRQHGRGPDLARGPRRGGRVRVRSSRWPSRRAAAPMPAPTKARCFARRTAA